MIYFNFYRSCCLYVLVYRYGVVNNSDSVLRSVHYKYLHPKEVFISDGVLVPDILRKKVSFIFAAVDSSALLIICIFVSF